MQNNSSSALLNFLFLGLIFASIFGAYYYLSQNEKRKYLVDEESSGLNDYFLLKA